MSLFCPKCRQHLGRPQNNNKHLNNCPLKKKEEIKEQEKSNDRLELEEKARALGVQGNIPGMKDATLAKKIEEKESE